MSDDALQILTDAIARNAAAVLSLPSAGMLRHHKTRFLGQSEEGFWLEAIPCENVLIDELIAGAKPAGVSFRGGVQRIAFTTCIIKRESEFRINGSSTVPALLLDFPEQVKAIQRRNYYRVRVSTDSDLRARVWRIPEHLYLRDRPMAAQEIPCEVRNISVGGIGLNVRPSQDPPLHLSGGDRLRVELTYREISFIIEGHIRHPQKMPKDTSNGVYCGVQFARLENNIEGRQNLASLTTIIGELQREEVRRSRLGVA